MDFLVIIISNIFTGALVYLILSLKIERTSSTIREKKLKREMNEIMTEFNSAAERNITLLEKRINQARNITAGEVPSKKIDFLLGEDEALMPERESLSGMSLEPAVETPVSETLGDHVSESSEVNEKNSFFNNLTGTGIGTKTGDEKEGLDIVQNEVISREIKTGSKLDLKVEDDIDINELSREESLEEDVDFDKDKYAAINELFNRGYTIDEISKRSGLPSGEVKLVVSLNN